MLKTHIAITKMPSCSLLLSAGSSIYHAIATATINFVALSSAVSRKDLELLLDFHTHQSTKMVGMQCISGLPSAIVRRMLCIGKVREDILEARSASASLKALWDDRVEFLAAETAARQAQSWPIELFACAISLFETVLLACLPAGMSQKCKALKTLPADWIYINRILDKAVREEDLVHILTWPLLIIGLLTRAHEARQKVQSCLINLEQHGRVQSVGRMIKMLAACLPDHDYSDLLLDTATMDSIFF